MVMSTTFSAPLLWSIFRTTKTQAVFERAVENEEHEMSHRDDRAFFTAPWRQSLKAFPKDRVMLTSRDPSALDQSGR